MADINADGFLDVVATCTDSPNNLCALLGNGDGTFRVQPSLTASGYLTSIAIGDYNGDGKLDIVTTGTSASFISTGYAFFLGNGAGTFRNGQAGPGGPYCCFPNSVALGDFMGNGKLNLVGNSGGQTTGYSGIQFRSLDANGLYGVNDDNEILDGSVTSMFLPYDVNHDGRLDLVAIVAGNAEILLGNGDETFTNSALPSPFAAGYILYNITAGDVNGDGNLDVVATFDNIVSGPSGSIDGPTQLAIYLGKGDGTFQATTFATTGIGSGGAASGDLNNDGKADVVFSNPRANTLTVVLGNS